MKFRISLWECSSRAAHTSAPPTTAPTPFELLTSPAAAAAAGSAANYLVCETNGRSPLSKHVQVVANAIKTVGLQPCRQLFAECTNWGQVGTAKVGLCGQQWWSIRCSAVAFLAEETIRACTKRIDGQSRVGGYVAIGDLLRVVLRHT